MSQDASKNPLRNAYAVVYRPEPPGRWTAELVDLGLRVEGADIDDVRNRIRAAGRQHARRLQLAEVPSSRTVVGYVHLDDRDASDAAETSRKHGQVEPA